MNIWLIYKKELISFFRDRHTIIYSLVLPILMYPLLFWGMNQIIMLQQGTLEKHPSRIAFSGSEPRDILFPILESDEPFEIASPLPDFDDLKRERLKKLKLDAVIRVRTCDQSFELDIFFDSSTDSSRKAKERLISIFNKQRFKLIVKQASPMSGEILGFDMASTEARSKYFLGMILPMIMIIIIVMGGLYPAIEVIVSERERKTLETTLSVPVSGLTIITGKFLAVVTMSMLAMLLNLFSILLTIRQTLFTDADTMDLSPSIPLKSIPLILFGALLISALFSAGMILLASFAKTFKEGQSFVSMLYVIGIQPAIVSALPGISFTSKTALIPIVNVSLMFRELIRGSFLFVPISITLLSLTVLCFVLLYVSRQLLVKEELVTGLEWKKIRGSLFRFLKRTSK